MPELESKQTLPRSEIAEYLHEFADELDTDRGDGVTGTGDAVDEPERRDTTDDARTPDAPIDESDRVDPETGERLPPEEAHESAPSDDANTRADTTTPEDRVTLIVGDDSATVNPPETADFEIEVDSDSSLVGGGEQQRVSFELEWEVEEVTDENEIEIT